MTHDWDQWSVRIPLTVLWLDDCQVSVARGTGALDPSAAQLSERWCPSRLSNLPGKMPFFNCSLQVVQQKTVEQEGYTAVQLGCGSKREKNVHFG